MKLFSSLVAVALVATFLAACDKDKFETKPKLEIKDFTREVVPNSILRFTLTYYDKEGDLGEAKIVSEFERLNTSPPTSPNDEKPNRFDYALPEFPDKDQGEITFDLPYESVNENPNFNDTLRFRFFVEDRAGNMSDTIVSEPIVARQN